MTGTHQSIRNKLLQGFLLGSLLLLSPQPAIGQSPPRPDSSPHTVRMVPVAEGVELEVLDWGGSGRPVVFLGGLGSTAHEFDSFAPRFTATHHVYAVTRRGFGASSRPAPDVRNYNAQRLGDDVLAVMEVLQLDHPVLAGHSLAGEELSSVASRYPDKLGGVVYLDAAYAYAYYAPGNVNPPNANLMIDVNSLAEKVQALAPLWQKPQEGLAAIDALLNRDLPQLRQDLTAARAAIAKLPPAPPMPSAPPGSAPSPQAKINQAILGGVEKFGSLKLPVLVIYASPHAPPPNPPSQAMLDYFHAVEKAADRAGMIERYRTGNPSARVVVIPNAQHAVFRSHPDDVAREMESFMGGLP